MGSSSPDRPNGHDAALVEHLRLLEATASANIDGVTISTAGDDLPLVYVNPGFERMTGYPRAEILGRNCRFLQGDDRDQPALDEIRAAIEEERPCRVTLRNYRKDGTLFWNELTLYPLHDDAGRLTHYVGIQRDVTERKVAEQRLVDSEQRLRLLEATATASVDGITISDVRQPDMPLVYISPGFERMTGYTVDEVLGRNCRFLQGDDRDQPALDEIRAAIEEERPCRVTLRNYRKDGTLFWNELTLYPLHDDAGRLTHYVGIQRDNTERKKLEAQFLQVQRLESIGRLVSGIAHDLGNLLMPILLGAKVLQQRYGDDEKAMRTLELIQQSGERGAEMVKQVLNFARGVEGERVPLPPATVIEEVEKIVTDTFPQGIAAEVAAPDDLWWVEGDATQIQQIMMNLCVNARDAMPDGGRITIEAANVTIDETMARMNLEARPGRFVRVAVTDTGTGMSSEVLDKVFDPFFSTKPSGRGTGLGLSTVYSIVKSHGGFVTVYSEVGAGTTFCFYLPAVESGRAIPAVEPSDAVARKGHGELILVVDDEPYILEATQDALERAGYTVITATNGAEALNVFDARRDDIAAVLTDLVMPIMGGIDAVRALRTRAPSLLIIAASGMGDGRAPEALEAGASRFLAKPFTAEALYTMLDALLGS